ncbi:hypothetical protein HDU83_004368 [Entophlyctis luteolus]|nr:hypothetical protein HDU83_004368 [Entophlyctis luteolus]
MDALGWSAHARAYEDAFARTTALFGADALRLAAIHQLAAVSLSIVDVACGPGLLACELARNGHRVLAVDFSPAMIESTRSRARSAGVVIDAAVADAADIATLTPAASSDFVVSIFGIAIFPHLSSRNAALAAAHYVLKPNATIVLTSWDREFASIVAMRAVCSALNLPAPSENPTTTREGFAAEIRAAGFSNVKMYTITHEFVFTSAAAFLEAICDNPFFKALPVTDIRTAKRVYLESVSATTVPDGIEFENWNRLQEPICYPGVAHVCIATKN